MFIGELHVTEINKNEHHLDNPPIEQALTDGYTSGSGLGLGLSGSKRLVDDFQIISEVGIGTQVTVTIWK